MATSWREKYVAELNRAVTQYEIANAKSPVTTRQMTEEEKERIFGAKPKYHQLNYVKENKD